MSIPREPSASRSAFRDSPERFNPISLLLPADGRAVMLDIGCGKGRFLRARAGICPDIRFIGIDVMFSRLRRLARRAGREGLLNISLWRGSVSASILALLPPCSITGCTIFFPDPWPKRRHHRRRLITPSFLHALSLVLVPDGHVYLATDHSEYFRWIARAFENQPAFRPAPPLLLPPEQQTDFEHLFVTLGHPVYRCGYRKQA